ncbi:MAG TPA: hypothetical protein VHN15_06865 [Thermoanaerobaculia bacterium]|nr:hypothetical protein [Thermoanaerobaculia bacterium]
MDQELVAFFEKKFGETAQQITSLREETVQQFASLREETSERFERVEESIRYTQITVEKMRDEIQLLAEGVSGFDEKLEAVRTELKAEIGEVRDLLTVSYRD